MNEGSCGEAVSLVIINFAFQIVIGALDQKDNMEVSRIMLLAKGRGLTCEVSNHK